MHRLARFTVTMQLLARLRYYRVRPFVSVLTMDPGTWSTIATTISWTSARILRPGLSACHRRHHHHRTSGRCVYVWYQSTMFGQMTRIVLTGASTCGHNQPLLRGRHLHESLLFAVPVIGRLRHHRHRFPRIPARYMHLTELESSGFEHCPHMFHNAYSVTTDSLVWDFGSGSATPRPRMC